MKWLGGIPINRSKPQDIVKNIAKLVEREKGIVIGLAPEGTRNKVEKWKNGFLRMAEATDCTIFMIGMDYLGKRVVLGDSFKPTGNHEADLASIMDYYQRFNGKYPDKA